MIEGRCISMVTLLSVGGAFNVASDASILVIPLFGISKLRMPLKKRLLAGSVFATGVFATAAAIIRFSYGLLAYWNKDLTMISVPIHNWATIEFTMGFIVAGAPCVPRFLQQCFGRKRRGSQASPQMFKADVYSVKVTDRTALWAQRHLPYQRTVRTITTDHAAEQV
ncbi:hypothetical protein E8E14_003973 [Neopestalotiopsis sp. 37M]|nr:hypothetical protein E8E14_003973 [Neopestalotiopsis sp. 37M]